ncbi:MAG: hybrid sensor histidine kinase/response regulator [Gammaproteobacteria bacterium]|nr:hybrid sensor histidine kinase/response regulator [Gammaproteobacteria bacterium]
MILDSDLSGHVVWLAVAALATIAVRASWRSLRAVPHSRHAGDADHSGNELLASLAHDLRSPMHGVLGSAEQLAREEQDPDRRRMLDEIRRTALHLIHVADDSLEWARLHHRQPAVHAAPFRLETVLADILATARPLCAADVELAVDLTRLEHGEFEGDPDRLRQILANVVHNSLARTRAGHVLLSARSGPRELDIDVQDTGPGIPQRQHLNLLSAFSQGSHAPGRAGMGLAIAERLAKALGGRLELRSQSGEGCRFRLRLPFRALPEPRPKPRGETTLQVGFADASTLERQILLRLLGSWNMRLCELDARDDVADWLARPSGLDALIVSQSWLGHGAMDDALRAHCRRHHIALVVLADDQAGDGGGQGQVPAHLWPRPLLPGELVTALDLRPIPGEQVQDAGPRVLVVDDHPLVRKGLAEAMHKLGATAILAHSGVAAVRAAGLGSTIDIVLLDRNMPGLDGIHAARALRRQPATQTATLILMVNDEADARAADVAAVDHVFVRPRGREAIQRGLAPLFEAAMTEVRPPAPVQSPPTRLLEDSLLEDLDNLAGHLEAGHRKGVVGQIHRLRGALNVFPSPRHQAWLEALDDATRDWRGADPPDSLRRAVMQARRTLEN